MTLTKEFIDNLRLKINDEKQKRSSLSENDTKAIFIEPLIQILGWDTHCPDTVSREFRTQSGDNPIDYMLKTHKPIMLIEAKALNISLDNPKWISQILGYAAASGVRWCVLSNGDHYRVYNVFSEVPIEQKLFISIDISDVNRREACYQYLSLLSKNSLSEQKLEILWNDHKQSVVKTQPAIRDAQLDVSQLDSLCAEYKTISRDVEALTEKKNELREQIITLMPENKLATAHFKITRYSITQVKTSLESARALSCVITKEDVDKDALKSLYNQGVSVPDITITKALRISDKKT